VKGETAKRKRAQRKSGKLVGLWFRRIKSTESHQSSQINMGRWVSFMGKKIIQRIVALVLVVGICAACTPIVAPQAEVEGTAADELREVALGVGFVPNVQFAVFYVGMEKGFFREEGIELELRYGFEDDYLKLVGTDALQFMIGSGDQVILGRSQGLPVRYVANWFSRYPVVVFARAEAGIESPGDLAGKRIGIPGPFGASYVAYRGILEAAGLTEADVQTESIGFNQAAAVSEGTVDAAVDYAVNGPVVLAQAGIETTQIALDSYLRIPANGLVTNEKTLESEPDLVAGMVRALRRSIEYTLANPDEAFEISLEFVPEAGGDNRAANRAVFDASLDYWSGGDGTTEAEDWAVAVEFMERIGLIETLPEVEELFTNEFLP
jgi:NitT/TauT family transport system substrate-binding protein